MALIRFGMGGQASGKVGGVVFSRNKGGSYIRNRTKPTNKNSQRQQERRAAFAEASQLWATQATNDQRLGWDSWATSNPIKNRLGETIPNTGRLAFIRVNAFLIGYGAQPRLNAPDGTSQQSIGDFYLQMPPVGTNLMEIHWQNNAAWMSDSTGFMVVRQSQYRPISSRTVKVPVHAIATIAPPSDIGSATEVSLDLPSQTGKGLVLSFTAYCPTGVITNEVRYYCPPNAVIPAPLPEV